MSDIARANKGGELAVFQPERFRLKQAALDYGIKEAKRIKDWPALEQAIEDKIAEQQKFVAWWDANVRVGGWPDTLESVIADSSLTAPEAAELTGMKPQRVSDLRGTLENEDLYRQVLVGPVYRRAYLREGDPRVHLNTGHIEWYTPAEYIELARQVLGGFDLDPASNEVAQATVRAQRYYSRDDSSLPHQWHGRVWMNPPYSRPLINQMMEKLCEEYAAGRVTGAIVLVNSCTEVKWFQECCTVARALCFPNKRIQFYNPEGKGGGPLQGQTFFYFGDATEVFAAAFKGIGVIVVPHA